MPGVDGVIATVVEHPLAQAYPPPVKHQLRFLKVWLEKLERDGTFDCSELYERIAVLVAGNTDAADWCYKSYWLSEAAAITLHESTKMVSTGTTGLCTWDGALVLAEWELANIRFFEGKTVVELGSGIGLAGILLAKGCKPSRVVLTDHLHDVLEALRTNIALNKVTAEVQHLDWTDGDAAVESLAEVAPDVMVASDIVFDPGLCSALASVINGVLTAATKRCELYISSTVRNPATLVQFVAELRGHGLVVTPKRLDAVPQLFPRTDSFPVEFHHVVTAAQAAITATAAVEELHGEVGAGAGAGASTGSDGGSYAVEVGRYGAKADAVDAAD